MNYQESIKEFLTLLESEFPPKENCRHAIYMKNSFIHIQMAFPLRLVHLVLSQEDEDASPKFLLENIKEFLKDERETLYNPPKEEKDFRQLSFDFDNLL
jgi:hypothetical protein